MSETPETDSEQKKANLDYQGIPDAEWPWPAIKQGWDFARDLERRLNAAIRERDNAESDRKHADADTIRALHERNEARAEIARLRSQVTDSQA